MAQTITLTHRQHELLIMDTYCEYPEGRNPEPDWADLRAELLAGRRVTVNDMLVSVLVELADRDADPAEQRIYRRVLANARTATDTALGA